MFDWLPNSKNSRFGRFRRPAELSAPKGKRFGRLWRDSRFHLLVFESDVNLLGVATVIGNFTLLPSTRLVIVLSTGNLAFVRMNLKPAILKIFVFEWEMCFHLAKSAVFRNDNILFRNEIDSSKLRELWAS